MLKHIILRLIYFYQIFISPLKPQTCRFYPSCSSYMSGAIIKYGILKGTSKGILRLLKCHPFHSGGYDPVE